VSYQIVYQNPVTLFDAWPEDPQGWFEAPPRKSGPEWMDAAKDETLCTAVIDKPDKALFLDLAVAVDLPWDQTGRYEHCQLHCDLQEPFGFAAPVVVCFRITHQRRVQRVRIALPGGVMGAPRVRFKLFPFPYCRGGRYFVQSMRLVQQEDQHEEPTRRAVLQALKDSIFQSAEQAERESAAVVHHYPNSLTLEITPRCNLTCSHCSSHGTAEGHVRYNKAVELDVDQLERLAEESFDSITEINLVGRGEPMVVSPRLWEAVVRRVRQHRVFLSITTNGMFVKRRVSEDLLPHIGILQFSIDGGSEASFRKNRGGASLEVVLENLAHFDRMRREAELLRRPRLSISWTMMKNNAAELAGFVRRMLQHEVDHYYLRHLMVWSPAEREDSLLHGDPSVYRPALREAYELFEEHRIRVDAPPLPAEPRPQAVPAAAAAPPQAPAKDRCMYVHRNSVIMADGDVMVCPTAGTKVAGQLQAAPSFWEIWNGPTMQDVRTAFDTPREWGVCRTCWYRASRYNTMRQEAQSTGSQTVVREEQLDEEMWDFSRPKA